VEGWKDGLMSDEQSGSVHTDIETLENREWLDSLDYVLDSSGQERVRHLLRHLTIHARRGGVKIPFTANTPYANTIRTEDQPPYPGSREIERRIKSVVRWNAMAMVTRANNESKGIGGHISSFASSATLYEVAFNHFLRGHGENREGDLVFFQGHTAPGMYARAFVEGRLSENQLRNFRRELKEGGGLTSYPHPWLMPDFWQFPTVSMGLGPIMSIYQARFMRYMEDRGLKQHNDQKVWAFLGDGETDEPESLGAISLASREKLNNLIWVVNCNRQRLDGPVRGNGQIIQELEATFRGAGWNVIKVVWGSDWDGLFAQDRDGLLVERLGEIVDGQFQKYTVSDGAYIREHLFGVDPRLLKMVEHLSDEQLEKLRLGGHDPEKVYAAYKQAVEHTGSPTVILAHTIKGYGMGESGEGKNITHQQKKLNEDEMREFRTRFGIPLSDDDITERPFYRPAEDSDEMRYLQERRAALDGYVPKRISTVESIKSLEESVFTEFYVGSEDRELSTTMAFVRILTKLLRNKEIGERIVPIVPDEARTFGMESLFRQAGIYSHVGQLYEPVDADNLLYYKEATDGQILEEGINEAGGLSSFIAAGTSYSTYGTPMIPFFIFYSMFGFQRVGDLIWAAADMRTRGFLIGGTAGRTTLAGEGLQHQDGNSHLLAYTVPNLVAYDPAFAFEIAVIVRDGIRRMYENQEDIFYYLTVENENYAQPAMPEGLDIEGILKGMYKFRASEMRMGAKKANLLASGAIVNEALKAAELLESKYGVAADVWSVTSFKELHREGAEIERWNMLHPESNPRAPYVKQALRDEEGVFVVATDYVKILPYTICRWFPKAPHSLGTDGFGRSEDRASLRDFFEVDHRFITLAALTNLAKEGLVERSVVSQAMRDLGIESEKANPVIS
jgi:pyruvate dehydrogenase E1 component